MESKAEYGSTPQTCHLGRYGTVEFQVRFGTQRTTRRGSGLFFGRLSKPTALCPCVSRHAFLPSAKQQHLV